MNEQKHIHSFVLEDYSVIGPECCFGPSPCTHCGGCITGSGTHDFYPSEEDGKYVKHYRCSVCGEILTVIE